MKLMLTKTGKIHLSPETGIAKCRVAKPGKADRPMNVEKELTPKEALAYPANKYCRRCFGDTPYSTMQQMAGKPAPEAAPEPSPAPQAAPEPSPAPQAAPEPSPAPEAVRPPTRTKIIPVDGTGKNTLDAIQAMIMRLENFTKDDANTSYKRMKASYYVESFYAIRDMLEQNNPEAINRVIERLTERGK